VKREKFSRIMQIYGNEAKEQFLCKNIMGSDESCLYAHEEQQRKRKREIEGEKMSNGAENYVTQPAAMYSI
jgi:hypothetical protein